MECHHKINQDDKKVVETLQIAWLEGCVMESKDAQTNWRCAKKQKDQGVSKVSRNHHYTNFLFDLQILCTYSIIGCIDANFHFCQFYIQLFSYGLCRTNRTNKRVKSKRFSSFTYIYNFSKNHSTVQ